MVAIETTVYPDEHRVDSSFLCADRTRISIPLKRRRIDQPKGRARGDFSQISRDDLADAATKLTWGTHPSLIFRAGPLTTRRLMSIDPGF